MKTIIKTSIILTIFTVLFSCSNSNDNPTSNNPQSYAFDMSQTSSSITELDNVVFSITNSNNANINTITWYVNNIQITPTSYTLSKTFIDFGTYIIKAKIDYNDSKTTTIEKSIVVTERPKNLVTISKVEITSYSAASQFETTYNGYYVKMKYEIRELDEYDSSVLKYISSENSQNWAHSSSMIYPISWDMSTANYNTKVYKSGSFYPNNQGYYNTEIIFYGAGSIGLIQQPYNTINDLKLDLNPYRTLHPTTINVSNGTMQIRLTLQWN
jgi:hypothetical protein